MGVILSVFRKEVTTKDKLEEIEKEINDIQDFEFYTQRRRKHLIGSLVLYSIVLYAISVIVFYFVYFPTERTQQLLYSLPFLVFPFVIWGSKWLLHLYYACKLEKGEDKLAELQRRKKRLLEEVMDKEPYKIAKEILERYDPDRAKKELLMTNSTGQMLEMMQKQQEIAKLTSQLRHRASIGTSRPSVSPPQQVPQIMYRSPQLNRVMPVGQQLPSASTALVIGRARPMPAMSQQAIAGMRGRGMMINAPIMRPAMPKQRSMFDRVLEYVVGDGPSNRYALICANCWSHNGMALMEEFEYISFRCRMCGFPNPARKMRPQAPSLPTLMQAPAKEPSTTSDSVSTSTDTEEEGDSPTSNLGVGECTSNESLDETNSTVIITEMESSATESEDVKADQTFVKDEQVTEDETEETPAAAEPDLTGSETKDEGVVVEVVADEVPEVGGE